MGYVCPKCSSDTPHPDDIANQYCPRCHKFHGDEAKYWEHFRWLAREAALSATPVTELWSLVGTCRRTVKPEPAELHAQLTRVAVELEASGCPQSSYLALDAVLDTLVGFRSVPEPDSVQPGEVA
jgi:hypothetical protein